VLDKITIFFLKIYHLIPTLAGFDLMTYMYIAPVFLVAGEDDKTRSRRQDYLLVINAIRQDHTFVL
jgi:hypothetical protein